MRNSFNHTLKLSKENHFKATIENSDNPEKELFRCMDELLYKKSPKVTVAKDDAQGVADDIASFFLSKVSKIRDELDKLNLSCSCETEKQANVKCYFESFDPVSEEEVKKIILNSPNKSCNLDPIPTFLLKKLLDGLLPVITKMINLSFSTKTVPKCWKIATVIPLLKKIVLGIDFSNLRPVSTLPFIVKTSEKIASKQLKTYKTSNRLDEKYQSSYKQYQSTETALLKIHNDIMKALDEKKGVFLVLLDMSAAFDTVDHDILLQRLSSRFGIAGDALNWIQSYLSDREMTVMLDGVKSKAHRQTCNVPQGSVCGPSFFCDYTSPICDIFRKHQIPYHLYADDTQIYVPFNLNEEDSVREKLEKCIQDVRDWLCKNYLKLNDSKTDFIILGSNIHLKKIATNSVKVGSVDIPCSESVRNIGAYFDVQMKMSIQVKKICSRAWLKLHQISKVKRFLTTKQLKTVIHAYVVSQLDYNNGLLAGCPTATIKPMQTIQNAAARLIEGIKKHEHLTPPLKELHWLPVKYRIDFKILLLVYKCLNGKGPEYLSELLIQYQPGRSLRSADRNLLFVPKSRLKTYGDRSFAVYGPQLWNNLPFGIRSAPSIESFKNSLKTHLFKIAHNV